MKMNNTKPLINQIHRVQGQMQGLEKMILENKYCVDIIGLSLAIQKSYKA